MGLDYSMFDYALEYLHEEESIFIIDLFSNTITLSSQLANLKKKGGKNKLQSKKDLLYIKK